MTVAEAQTELGEKMVEHRCVRIRIRIIIIINLYLTKQVN